MQTVDSSGVNLLFLAAQTVKRLSTMRETRVRSLDWEDPLEKEMAIHSRTIAWKIPWTEDPGRLQSMGSQRVGHDWVTSLHFTSMLSRASHVAQWIKNLPAMQGIQETWVQSLDLEDPLEEEMATHSSYSCLGNPMDRGAWQAAVHRVTKNQKRLKQLSMHALIVIKLAFY